MCLYSFARLRVRAFSNIYACWLLYMARPVVHDDMERPDSLPLISIEYLVVTHALAKHMTQ